MVLRVSRMIACVSVTASTYVWAAVAVADSTLQEIQRRTFAGQYALRGAANGADQLIGLGTPPFVDVPVDRDRFVELPEDFIEPRPAAEDAVFAGNDPGLRPLSGRYQRCRQVARADILGQRDADRAGDVVGETVAFLRGHAELPLLMA